MAKVDLTLSESKTKADLTLEAKDASQTWADMDFTWDDTSGTWAVPLTRGDLESKTKADLSLESK
jgi:hypothetical protein